MSTRGSHYGEWHTVNVKGRALRIRARASQEQLQTLCDEYCEHQDYRRASRQVGVSRRMGHAYLDKMGLIERTHQIKHTEYRFAPTGAVLRARFPWGTIHQAVQLYFYEGLSTRDVESRVGVSHDTIHSWMERLGIARGANVQKKLSSSLKAGFRVRSELVAEMKRLRSHDATIEEIAQALGLGKTTVRRILPKSMRRNPHKMLERRRERCRAEGRPFSRYTASKKDDQRRAERRRLVARWAAEGIRPMDIAAAADVCVATVYKDLKRIRSESTTGVSE